MSKNPWGGIAGEAFKDKLKASDIEGDRIVLTCTKAFVLTIYDKGTGEVKDSEFAVEFAEFPDKTLRCSKTQAASFRALSAAGKLPNNYNEVDESFDWEGLSIPLYKKDVMYENEAYPKLFAVSPSAFDKALVEWPKHADAKVKKVTPNRRRPRK